jgi:hypothetical protein
LKALSHYQAEMLVEAQQARLTAQKLLMVSHQTILVLTFQLSE